MTGRSMLVAAALGWAAAGFAIAMAKPQGADAAEVEQGESAVALAQDEGARALQPVAPAERLDVASLLSESDLDVRERSFERIVERAADDELVREELEALARGADASLAWSARLALREVASPARARAAHPSSPFAGGDPFDAMRKHVDEWFGGGGLDRDPFQSLFDDPFFRSPLGAGPGGASPFQGDPFARMQEHMQRLQQEMQRFRGLQPGRLAPNAAPGAGGDVRFQGESRSVRITPDGVEVEVTEEGPEGTTTRKYEARTLDELYEAHPELRDEVRVFQTAPGERTPAPPMDGTRPLTRRRSV